MDIGQQNNILIVAGGTGGHIFPALALADCLRRLGMRPIFITDRRGLGFLPQSPDIPLYSLSAGSFVSKNLISIVSTGYKLVWGLIESRILISRLAPVAVIGFGGYASVATVLVASQMKIPTIIHEANTVMGRANRFLAARVSVIATSSPETKRLPICHKNKVVYTGVPVREHISAITELAVKRLGPKSRIRLLVTGGSQGSRTFSAVVPRALAKLPFELRHRLFVVHQCRHSEENAVKLVYETAKNEAKVEPFIENMVEALEGSHLVVCRAGASTLAELAVAGRPAVIIPYPYATDDHQTANAQALLDSGAGWMVHEKDLDVNKLKICLFKLLSDVDYLVDAGGKARALSRPEANHLLARLTCDLIAKSGSLQEAI